MKTKKTNESLVNNSNQTHSKALINHVDKLLTERLPDLVEEELKWLRKEYGNDEISKLLNSDDYYLHSTVLNKLNEIYSLPFTSEY
jgi:hypothetical protein